MFNWSSVPTFAAMLLFWLFAAYVVTRSPHSLVSATAVTAQVSAAVFLLGQGMSATIWSHAFVDLGRRVLDRVFYK